jgi:hypothetical protein
MPPVLPRGVSWQFDSAGGLSCKFTAKRLRKPMRNSRTQYRNHLGGAAMALISDWLHSDEASRVDNSRKGEVLIPLQVDAGNVVQYATHFPRTYSGTWVELLRRFRLSNLNCWKEVQAAWNGKNGGNNFTRKNKSVVFEKKVRTQSQSHSIYYCAHYHCPLLCPFPPPPFTIPSLFSRPL